MRNIYVCFFSLMLLLVGTTVHAQKTDTEKAVKDTVYRGINIKLDLFNPIYTMASTGGKTYACEALVNINLLNKYFPTIELGYAGADQTPANQVHFDGSGFFTRIGSDFNLMKKKNNTQNNFFLGGLRFGMSMQQFEIENLLITDNYWNTQQTIAYPNQFKFDCWGEIVAGIQVNIAKGVTMGWSARVKLLITRGTEGNLYAWYIPGFGVKKDTNFGFNYYIGYNIPERR